MRDSRKDEGSEDTWEQNFESGWVEPSQNEQKITQISESFKTLIT